MKYLDNMARVNIYNNRIAPYNIILELYLEDEEGRRDWFAFDLGLFDDKKNGLSAARRKLYELTGRKRLKKIKE